MQQFWLILVGVATGITASMGFGGGFLLLLYLSFFSELSTSQGGMVNLLFFLPIAAVSICFHAKNQLIEKSVLPKAILTGVIGVVLGFILLPMLPQELLRKLFGGLTVLVGLKELFSKAPKKEVAKR